MTDYERWSLGINASLAVATVLLAGVALWGEKLRQWWTRPRLKLLLAEPNLTFLTGSGRKGWYYQLHVLNERTASPAENVQVLLTKVLKKGADGSWQEHRFSGPVQVKWRIPEPQTATVGPDRYATWAVLHENSDGASLNLYWTPNNLSEASVIGSREPVRLHFKAVSNTAESNEVALEVAWDGAWVEGRTEMAQHMIVKQV